ALLETDVEVKESCWIAARCWSEAGAYAQTSPVYVEVEGSPPRPTEETFAPFLAVLEETQAWVETQANCPSEKHRDQLRQALEDARNEIRLRSGRQGQPE